MAMGSKRSNEKKHLDSHFKMTRDLQGEFQAWLVVAAFEITDGLIVDPDRFGQLPSRYAVLSAKKRNSVI